MWTSLSTCSRRGTRAVALRWTGPSSGICACMTCCFTGSGREESVAHKSLISALRRGGAGRGRSSWTAPHRSGWRHGSTGCDHGRRSRQTTRMRKGSACCGRCCRSLRRGSSRGWFGSFACRVLQTSQRVFLSSCCASTPSVGEAVLELGPGPFTRYGSASLPLSGCCDCTTAAFTHLWVSLMRFQLHHSIGAT
eukprot:5885949-Pleurochrysis_carterae.AAC.1